MLKKDLILALAKKQDVSVATATQLVELMFQAFTDTLFGGGRIEIRGFGTFCIRTFSAYNGRNPKTGSSVVVAAKKAPRWKSARELNQRINRDRLKP